MQATLKGAEDDKWIEFSARLVETGGKRLATGRDFDSNGTLRCEVTAGYVTRKGGGDAKWLERYLESVDGARGT